MGGALSDVCKVNKGGRREGEEGRERKRRLGEGVKPGQRLLRPFEGG